MLSEEQTGLPGLSIKQLHALPVRDLMFCWDEIEAAGRKDGKFNLSVRMLCLADLYYLLVRVCGRVDMLPCVNRPGFIDNQFAFERCREVEANPDGYLDLWSRELWKSSIITFGLTLQTILKDPEITIGIFSHTRPIAKAFLRTLMREMEGNRALHAAFPDIFYGSDIRAYQKFSEDDGVIVKRKTNPNESTIEAWGLVDGQPTSRHFQVLVYDDVVVQGSVSTPEMIAKTMTAMELSYNLGTTPGVRRAIGTRYHFNDAYSTLLERGTFKRREYPGRVGGTEEGESIVWSEETHHAKRAAQGPHTYASQILLNPKADSLQGFQREWLRHYRSITPAQASKMNKYILVDAASSKKKGSDFTAMLVIGLGTDGNYYVLDMVRDRLSLTERAERLFDLHRRWKPRQVRYEKYGLMADVDHMKSKMETDSYRFDITEVAGQTKKADRIGRLIPIFEQGKMWLPKTLHITDYQKNSVDLVRVFVEEEYASFPVGIHDDMLDALARIVEPDLRLTWPKEEKVIDPPPRPRDGMQHNAWMA